MFKQISIYIYIYIYNQYNHLKPRKFLQTLMASELRPRVRRLPPPSWDPWSTTRGSSGPGDMGPVPRS